MTEMYKNWGRLLNNELFSHVPKEEMWTEYFWKYFG